MPNLVFLTCFSLQILGKTQTGVFPISEFSGQSLIKKDNCHNSKTSHDVDMKLGSVTKLDKRNRATLKIFGDDVMSENCEVIAIFPIYGQFGVIRKPDFGRKVCKTFFLLIVTFYLTKIENRTKKSLTQLSHYCFEWRYDFGQKKLIFCKKNAEINRIKRVLVLKGIFSETTCGCVLKCQILRF